MPKEISIFYSYFSFSSLSCLSLSFIHFPLFLPLLIWLFLSLPLSNPLPSHLISSHLSLPPHSLLTLSVSDSLSFLILKSELSFFFFFFGESNSPHSQISMELKSMWIVRYLYWVKQKTNRWWFIGVWRQWQLWSLQRSMWIDNGFSPNFCFGIVVVCGSLLWVLIGFV